jgi:arabinofuranan 3-O-arabinosyltransferase
MRTRAGDWPVASNGGPAVGLAEPVDERGAAVPERPRVPAVGWFFLVWFGALVVLLANDPGRMIFDTKLSVDLDPVGYYASLWHLWDPLDAFGSLNNQAIGYAVPMAPFYLAGQLAHAPVWLTERLWISLIIAVGFSGLVKLAGALSIGSPASRFWAGLAFALWPTFIIVIGSTSAAVLPGMLAPWAVLPLVSATRAPGPGPAGLRGWRMMTGPAARSGIAVLCMGGVNATSTIDALLLPALFILTHARGRRLVCLAVCWGTAVAMATAWWALPLLLQGKYAFNFLPYVEQASTTTATSSAATVLRGAGNWIAYLNFGTLWLPAAWALVTTPFAIAAAGLAAAFGLYGLSLRGMPEAAWLRLSAGVAAAGALAGYAGPLGGPFHQTVQNLLNGPLAPFRNVYKLEPVIAAALALGLAHATAGWLRRATDEQSVRRAIAAGTRLVIGVALIGLALPYLSDRVLSPGSFPAVPGYWYQAAEFLAAASPRNPALVVPADAHGEYLWGDPIDDPLEVLARSPWVERALVPYGGAGSQILLTTAEQAIESGEQVNGLAAYLARAGIRYVVVRNDLDPQQLGYTSPAVVHETLALSGYTRVAAFGPLITGAQTAPDAAPEIQAVQPAYPAVEIFAPAGTVSGKAPPLSPVTTLPVSQTVLVNGGPDSLLQLAGQDLLGPGQPVIIAGDALPATPAQWDVTDGQRRADTAFGLVNSNVSFTYTANETNPVDDQLGGAGGPPRQLLPVPAAGHQTVAVLSGAAQVTASSYGYWLDDVQQEDPVGAFDGDPATAWTEGSPQTPVGQWIQITFDQAMDLPSRIGIRLLADSPQREMADQLRVSTAAGSTTTKVAGTGAVQPLNVVPGQTTWLRVTITGARGVTPLGLGAGISDVLIPGVHVTRLLQPAEDPAGQRAASVSFSFQQQVPSPFALGNPAATPALARTFTLAGALSLRLRASALALPGAGLDALLDKLRPPGPGVLEVSAASPGAGNLVSLIEGSGSVPWVAGTAAPVIHLSWHGMRRIGSLVVQPAYGGFSAPETVKISSPDGTREAAIGYDGLVVFGKPLTTDRIDVSFPRVQQVTAASPTGQVGTLPVALSGLSVPALAGLRVATPDEKAKWSLGCGQGPVLTVDGRAYQTAVSGTIGELSQYLPLRVRLCTPGGMLTLGAGHHTLTAATPGRFAVTDLSLTSAGGGAAAASATGSRTVAIGSWQPDQRRLIIGPGPASYLEIHQNYNSGWAATLNGRILAPVRLDGWQQGYVVPAGAGGTIALTFRPAGPYHVALAASVLAAIVLVALAGWPALTRFRRGTGPDPAASSAWPAATAPARIGRGSQVAGWLGPLGVLVLIFVAGGLAALAVPVLGYLAWRRPRWLPAVALAGMAASGLLAAAEAQPIGPGLGAFSAPAQAFALVALAAALMPTPITFRPDTGRQARQDPG